MKALFLITADGGPIARDLCVFNVFKWLQKTIKDVSIVAICKSISEGSQITLPQDSIVIETSCEAAMFDLCNKKVVWAISQTEHNANISVGIFRLNSYETAKKALNGIEYFAYSEGAFDGDDKDPNVEFLYTGDGKEAIMTVSNCKTLKENNRICVCALNGIISCRSAIPKLPIALWFAGDKFKLIKDFRD